MTYAPCDVVDPKFIHALGRWIGLEQELEFERRGRADTNYTLHGRLIGIDLQAQRIKILRTRTHAGEIHEMLAEYVLGVRHPDGTVVSNEAMVRRDREFRNSQNLRVAVVERAVADPEYLVPRNALRSVYMGCTKGPFGNTRLMQFDFADSADPSRRASICAKSLASAVRFMSWLDIWMSLDALLISAIRNHILWPGHIRFECHKKPSAGRTDWPRVFSAMDQLSHRTLEKYISRAMRGYTALNFRDLDETELPVMLELGLVQYEPLPLRAREVLAWVQMPNLRVLAREYGSSLQLTNRAPIVSQLMERMNPAIEARARGLMRPPKLLWRGPDGMSPEAFEAAIRELRNSIGHLRRWLRDAGDVYRDEALDDFIRSTEPSR